MPRDTKPFIIFGVGAAITAVGVLGYNFFLNKKRKKKEQNKISNLTEAPQVDSKVETSQESNVVETNQKNIEMDVIEKAKNAEPLNVDVQEPAQNADMEQFWKAEYDNLDSGNATTELKNDVAGEFVQRDRITIEE